MASLMEKDGITGNETGKDGISILSNPDFPELSATGQNTCTNAGGKRNKRYKQIYSGWNIQKYPDGISV